MTCDEKIEAYEEISEIEGTELGDALSAACRLVHSLSSLGDDEFKIVVMKWLEKECKAYLKNAEDEDIELLSKKTYKYFTGKDKPEIKVKLKRGKQYIYQYGKRQEIVEFGYFGQEGRAICYPPGEVNGQDAMAIDIKDLKELK